MRDSPSLSFLPTLREAGATIRAFDPEGMGHARKLMPDLDYCRDAYETMNCADALILITEWNEFSALDLQRVKRLMRVPLIVDLRNLWDPVEMAAAGFAYYSIGRPNHERSVKPNGGYAVKREGGMPRSRDRRPSGPRTGADARYPTLLDSVGADD
jgi:hypothetical protein